MKKACLIIACLLSASIAVQAQTQLKGKILKIDFSSQVAERGGSDMSLSLGGISSSRSVNLLSAERAINAAASDDKVAAIFLKTDKYASSVASAEELRACLERFKAAGKPVIAYNTGYSAGSYYLASVADKVVLNPAGEGSINGLSSTIMFYKDLLDTLGIKIQLIRHGKYKSAGEPYIRNDISEENREQYAKLLGSTWKAVTDAVEASRGLAAGTLDRYAEDLTLSNAKSWLDAGLVDNLWHKEEMEEYLCSLFGVKKVELLNIVSLDSYIDKLKKGPAKNKIAVVYADGGIGSGESVKGIATAQTIADVRADSTVKAIVFRVNSPGGAVLDSDLIRHEIDEARKVKPVIASYGSYAASGGYWISSSTDRIFTDKTTLTGSIGVFGMVPVVGDAIRGKLKVNPVTIGTHSHSDMTGAMRELDEEEQAWMQKSIEEVYSKFVALVAQGRSLEEPFVDSIAQGRVWTGADALELGLTDQIGTALDAVEYAAEQLGLSSYRVVYYPEKKSVSLMSMLKGKTEETPLVEIEAPSAVRPVAQALQQAEAIVGTGPSVQARLPYLIEIH